MRRDHSKVLKTYPGHLAVQKEQDEAWQYDQDANKNSGE